MYLFRLLLLFIASQIIGIKCISQPLSFENYTSTNGISQNSGYAVGQTPEGFIWLGTQNGLNRYDSHDIITYRNIKGDSNSLSNNFITSLCTDNDGNLWVGTRKGVNIYNRYTNTFSSPSVFFKCDGGGLDKTDVKRIAKSSSGTMWVLTKDDGLYAYNLKAKLVHHFFATHNQKTMFRGIAMGNNDQIWLSTENEIIQYANGVFKPLSVQVPAIFKNVLLQELLFYNNKLWIGSLNAGLFTISAPSIAKQPQLKHADLANIGGNWGSEITTISTDSKGNILVGTTSNGLFVINSKGTVISNCIHDPSNVYSLNKNYILSIFEDAQGLIWVGTSGGGFSKYDSKKLLFNKQVFNTSKSLTPSSNMIMSLFNNNDNAYYLGTLAGGMIRTNADFSKKHYFLNHPNNKHSLLHNTIYGFAKDNKGILWLATKMGLCSYNPVLPDASAFNQYPPDSSGPQKYFYSIIKLKNENALLVAGYNGIFKFDLNTKKWIDLNDVEGFATKNILNARYMLEIDDSNILLCTEGMGLIEYDYKKGYFVTYQAVNQLTATVRHALLYEKYLWLATDNGLLKFNLNSKKVEALLNKNDGLLDDVVYAILPAANHTIWMSTNNGLARIHTQKLTCKYYDEGYGLQGMEFNTACCFTTQNGNICFGGINGINIFNPTTIPEQGFVAPTVITNISAMNKVFTLDSNISYSSKIRVKYDENFLNISVATLNFSHSEKNIYAYRLIGVDADWVYSGTYHVAAYTQLKPGSYTFEVKGANSNGQWSPVQQLQIIVTPPWWLTWWMKLGYLVVSLIVLYIIYQAKITAIKNKEKIKTQILEYELKALHAQMNPHFIFNCLASIKQMIIDDDKENANKYLNKFSKLIRQTLDQSRKPLITIAENNAYLTNYIEMEQLRFPGHFSYYFEIDNTIEDDLEIPPMMVQPLIENAIWHGLMPNNHKDGKLIIRYQIQKHTLLCIVDDNGVGFNEKNNTAIKHNSYGIENIQKRLNLLKEANGLDVSLEIIDKNVIDKNTNGTIATLTFTINKIK